MQTQQHGNVQDFQPKKVFPVAGIIALLVVVVISWNSITVTIDAGNRGVLFRKFGGGIDLEHVYPEGFHFIAPWNTMTQYEVRQQEIGISRRRRMSPSCMPP